MASSNIKLFDENKGNMLSDSEFSISNQRMNGLQTGVASSQLQNKAMYQASLVAYAIAQVMMQNGLNANDTDAVSAFVANLSGTMLQKVYDLATTAEAQAGVATGKWMSPALVKAAIDSLAAKAQNILSDNTKALYGLDSGAVPDDVFKDLNKYVSSIVKITTLPEASCIVKFGEKVIASGVADSNGKCTLFVMHLGNHQLICTSLDVSLTVDLNIPYIGIFDVVASPSLEEVSWGVINMLSENGLASSVFNVGDKKTVAIDGVNYQVQIIGFNHDTKTAGGTAGITFQLVDCLNSTYKMNSSNTNSGGWTSCEMRTSTMAAFLTKLPSALQNVIKDVNKLTSAGSQSDTINTTSDKLFLLSEVEIFGSAPHSKSGEGRQYDYYKAGNSKVKKVNSSASNWWDRSPGKDGNNYFCYVDSGGTASGGINISWASKSFGVSFAFCV